MTSFSWKLGVSNFCPITKRDSRKAETLFYRVVGRHGMIHAPGLISLWQNTCHSTWSCGMGWGVMWKNPMRLPFSLSQPLYIYTCEVRTISPWCKCKINIPIEGVFSKFFDLWLDEKSGSKKIGAENGHSWIFRKQSKNHPKKAGGHSMSVLECQVIIFFRVAVTDYTNQKTWQNIPESMTTPSAHPGVWGR